jgi:hypothetical protein
MPPQPSEAQVAEQPNSYFLDPITEYVYEIKRTEFQSLGATIRLDFDELIRLSKTKNLSAEHAILAIFKNKKTFDQSFISCVSLAENKGTAWAIRATTQLLQTGQTAEQLLFFHPSKALNVFFSRQHKLNRLEMNGYEGIDIFKPTLLNTVITAKDLVCARVELKDLTSAQRSVFCLSSVRHTALRCAHKRYETPNKLARIALPASTMPSNPFKDLPYDLIEHIFKHASKYILAEVDAKSYSKLCLVSKAVRATTQSTILGNVTGLKKRTMQLIENGQLDKHVILKELQKFELSIADVYCMDTSSCRSVFEYLTSRSKIQ